ncbi:MAG: hypothetical protein JKY67_22275 [Pseudomonadales bacterium]|nr:hypothetical protein [Pseudomonadales bacterium]
MPFAYKGALEDHVVAKPVQLKAVDLRTCEGIFYSHKEQPRSKVAVLAIHPRVDFSRHYCIPPLVNEHISVLGLNSRCFNNDTTAIHEQLILDVNAGVQYLKEVAGAEVVVLFGNSGGGSLSALFQSQAMLPKGERIAYTPAGDATKLNNVDLIPADAFMAISAHKGQGAVLSETIDPSVMDEEDPRSTNPELDMYDEANGFREPPSPSRYSELFITEYRKAQLARVQKLDDVARAMIAEAKENDRLYHSSQQKSFMEKQKIGRLAALEQVMVIYRTMANLKYTDPSLDPSTRPYGSLLSDRPDLMNMQYLGFARVLSPQAWLSTWSGLSSNANLVESIATLDVPIFVANAKRVKEIYPSQAQEIWKAVTSTDRTFMEFEANHYFEPEFGAQSAPDVAKLMQEVVAWIKDRFGE